MKKAISTIVTGVPSNIAFIEKLRVATWISSHSHLHPYFQGKTMRIKTSCLLDVQKPVLKHSRTKDSARIVTLTCSGSIYDLTFSMPFEPWIPEYLLLAPHLTFFLQCCFFGFLPFGHWNATICIMDKKNFRRQGNSLTAFLWSIEICLPYCLRMKLS